MEYQTAMTYSENVTTSHPLAQRYQILLDAALRKEGARNTPFTTEKCIDLDKYETERSRGRDKGKSMDFMTGLSNRQMLLIEAKLEVKEPINLKKAELEGKIRQSLDILREHEYEIAREKVFLFSADKIGRARSHVSKLFNNNPNLKIFTVQELYDAIIPKQQSDGK